MKRRSKKSLKELFLHTQSRLGLRLGHLLSQAEYDEMGQMIRKGQAELLERQSGSRSLYRLTLGEHSLVVAYNRELGGVATYLDEWMYQMNKGEGVYVAAA